MGRNFERQIQVMEQMQKILMNEKEMAQLLSISWRALQEYRKRRLIPYVKLGRRVLYRRSDVERALDRLTIRAVT